MNTRRLVLALLVALMVSGLFTFVIGKKVLAKRAVVNNKYVVAGRPLEAGEMLKPDSLGTVDWPASVPLPGGFQKIEAVSGRIVLYPLAKGEPILDRQLAAPGSGAGLSAKIPEGMRAISLKSDEVVGVAGFLLPGTHVDVLETDREIGTSGKPNTSTVLQDVEVLAAGQKIEPDPEGKANTVNVVTLLLKPADAEKVVQASSVGTIHFVLRNGSDRTQIVDSSAPRPPAFKAAASHVNQPLVAPNYTVETQMGDKKVITTFN